jgi:DNA-binding transcriptional ArsR family regulator
MEYRGISAHEAVDIASVVPRELQLMPQWIVWRYEQRDGRIAKVPIDPRTGYSASTTNGSTWGDFSTAVAVKEKGSYQGIGFVFNADDRYVGIDLDDCVDETGKPEAWAATIVERFDGAYAEWSPSGRGVHLIAVCDAQLPPGNRQGNIEVYQRARFFTITGMSLRNAGQRTAVSDMTTEVLAWHSEVFGAKDSARRDSPGPIHRKLDLSDQEVVELARRSQKSGERFRRLYAGDANGYRSQSEADMALCRMIAFYTQDVAQIARVFCGSGLNRDKWVRQASYRENTISKALGSLSATYDPAYRSLQRDDKIPELPDDRDELKRLLWDERRKLGDAEARLELMSELISMESRILGNRELAQARLTAVALSRFFAHRESERGCPMTEPEHVSLCWLAERCGLSDDTVGRHLTKLTSADLIIKRKVSTSVSIDQTTGMMVPPRYEVQVMPKAANAKAFAAAAASYRRPTPAAGDSRTTWGGKRGDRASMVPPNSDSDPTLYAYGERREERPSLGEAMGSDLIRAGDRAPSLDQEAGGGGTGCLKSAPLLAPHPPNVYDNTVPTSCGSDPNEIPPCRGGTGDKFETHAIAERPVGRLAARVRSRAA